MRDWRWLISDGPVKKQTGEIYKAAQEDNHESCNVTWLNAHQQAEAVFEFLEDVDELLLWRGTGLCRE